MKEFKGIETGDLLVWDTTGWSSKRDLQLQLVRLFTRSQYTHVGIAYRTKDEVFVVEATPPHVRIFPLRKLLPVYHVDLHLKLNEDQLDYLFKHVGDDYSLLQVAMTIFMKPMRDRNWHCVELCKDFYEEVLRMDLGDDYTPGGFLRKMLSIQTPSGKLPIMRAISHPLQVL